VATFLFYNQLSMLLGLSMIVLFIQSFVNLSQECLTDLSNFIPFILTFDFTGSIYRLVTTIIRVLRFYWLSTRYSMPSEICIISRTLDLSIERSVLKVSFEHRINLNKVETVNKENCTYVSMHHVPTLHITSHWFESRRIVALFLQSCLRFLPVDSTLF
jgi:hypothetical protein